MLTEHLPRADHGGEPIERLWTEPARIENARIEDARIVSTRPMTSDAGMPAQGSLLQTLTRHRRTAIVAAAATLLTAGAVIASLTPQYESDSLVLYDAGARNPADLRDSQSVAGRPATDLNDVRSQLKIVASPQIAGEVLIGLSDADRAVLDRRSALAGLLAAATGRTTRRGADPGPDDELIRRYLDRLTAFNDGRSYVIEVAFRSGSAELSQRVLERHLAVFLDRQLDAQRSVVNGAQRWFERELETLRARLVDAEARLQAFRQRSDLLLAEGETLRSRELATITRALAEARFDLARKAARHAELSDVDGRSDSLVASSELIQKLRTQEADTSRQIASMQRQFGASYPPLVARRAELADVRERIDAETRRLNVAAGGDLEIARQNVARLEGDLKAAVQALGTSSQDELSAIQVEREIQADRQVYDRLLERSREVSLQGLLQPLEFRVVSSPTLAETPVAPRRALLLLLALPLSLVLGLAAALAAQWRDQRRVASLSLLEQNHGLYGLGALPVLKPARPGSTPGEMAPQAASLVSGIQSLRNALVIRNDGVAPRTIVYSSALPGDGKTATATLYARSLAMAGERVLLIDADLRRRTMTRSLLGKVPDRGVIDCLRGLPLEQAIRAEHFPRLDLLPVGNTPAGSAGLIDHGRVRVLLALCRRRYRVVIIDTPPLCALDDASAWSSNADATVLVAKWRVTPTGALLDAARRVRRSGGRLAGIVLSATDMKKYQAREGAVLAGRPYPCHAADPAE